MQQLCPYASRVTLSLRHAALESLPQGHDQAASSDAAAARHAWLRTGGVARRGVLLLSFVNRSISDAHAALESIAARKMHWMPFGMQEAIGAGRQKSSPRFAWGRGTICMCYPVRQRCFDTCTRGSRRKQPAVLLAALEASPDDHFSAIGSRFKIRWRPCFYSTSPSRGLHVGGTKAALAVSREIAFTTKPRYVKDVCMSAWSFRQL